MRPRPALIAVGVAALLTACLRWASSSRGASAKIKPVRAALALDLLMPASLVGLCQERLGAFAGDASTIEDIVQAWGRRTKQLSGSGSGLQTLRNRRYFIAAMHRNGGGGTFAPAGWQRELLKLIYTLGNEDLSNIFVSIYESHGDTTQMGPSNDLDALLHGLGVPHALVQVIELEAHPDRDTLPRVEFLARLQNLALLPLLESEADFDSVLYLSDVLFCAADAIDLLRTVDSRGGINADMSCSVDYIGRDPSQPQQDETRLHDTWAAHDMLGVNMVNDYPYMCHADGQSSFDHGEPFEVFACWNGMVALDADVFQRLGARFRSARNYECQLSESELLARDMRVLGRGRIIMVPTAKVAYSWDVFKAVTLPENKGLPEPLALRGPALSEPEDAMCCSIDRSRSRVLLETCVTQRRWRLPYEAFGIPVAPYRSQLNIGALDLVPLGKAGLDAARERFAAMPALAAKAAAAAAASAAAFHIPQRIVQWGSRSEGWADDGQTLLEMSSLSYVAANNDLQFDVVSDAMLVAWATSYARSSEFSRGVTHAFRSPALRVGFQRLLYMFHNGGIFVPTASWGGEPFAEVIKPEDQVVVGVAVDRRSKERHLLFLAATPQSAFLEAAVEASRAALRLPEATYRRMWDEMPRERSLEELEDRYFTGVELLFDVAKRIDFAGVRFVNYDLAVASFDVGRPEAVCAGMGDRREALALAAPAGSDEEAANSPVYFDPQLPSRLVFTGSLGEEQRVGIQRSMDASWLRTSNHLLAGQYLRSAGGGDKSFEPLTAMAPLEECRVGAVSAEGRCFLFHSPRGELAIYRGMGLADPSAKLVSLLAAPPAHSHYASESGERGRQPTATFTYLVLQDDGNLVLYGSGGDAAAPVALWGAGWAFPADCPVDSDCRRLAYVALRSDGRLALHRGTSPAMQAYLEVGAVAVDRLRGCLRADDTRQLASAVRSPPGEAGGSCKPPRALKLVALPKSGAAMTMEAVMAATGATVYTADEEAVEIAGEDTPEQQELCGNNACQDLGMCQLGLGHRWGEEGEGKVVRQPAPGKGALLLARSDSYGPGDVGGASEGLAAYATALARGAFALPVDSYGFLHLMRNPFDHLVARFRARAPASSAPKTESVGSRAQAGGVEGVEASSLWSGTMYDVDAFLSDNGRFPKRDIYTYLYWHLSMNVLFTGSGLPTATLTYEKIYQDPVGFLAQVVGFLGYNRTEVGPEGLARASSTMTGHEYIYYRGQPVPAYLNSYYDADTVYYISNVISEVLDKTECLSKAVFPVPGDLAEEESAPVSAQ